LFASTAAALLFVPVIVGVAVLGNRVAGVITSLSAALWFDFFLTKPYARLAISHRPDIETTICLLVVGVVVTEMAARNRHHHLKANEESDFVAVIHDLADLAAGPATTPEVIARAASSLIELLHLSACRFEAGSSFHPLARIGQDGEVVHAGIRWQVHEIGIPGPEAEILVQWRGQVMGRFLLSPTPGWPVSHERRVVAVALADLVGAALDTPQSVTS
jgi:hypothetical protein